MIISKKVYKIVSCTCELLESVCVRETGLFFALPMLAFISMENAEENYGFLLSSR